jgi:chitinase
MRTGTSSLIAALAALSAACAPGPQQTPTASAPVSSAKPASQAPEQAAHPSRRVLVAYLSGLSGFDERSVQAEKLTHINYAFAKIKEGRVVDVVEANFGTPRARPDWAASGREAIAARVAASFQTLQRIKAEHAGLRTLIAIGGWEADGFSDAALTPDSRELFAHSALSFMQAHGFDGVDLDWEYPSNDMAKIRARPEDKQNFTLMLAALRQKLDALSDAEGRHGEQRYLLSIAAGAGQYYLDGVELEKVGALVDYINLMTYDLYNGYSTVSGHHTNLFGSLSDPNGDSGDKAVRLFESHGVPAHKLVLGAAFYGRGLHGVPATNSGLMQPGTPQSNFAKPYREIKTELIGQAGWVRYWDEAAKAPYLYNGEAFVTYDDPQSLTHKARYVREHDLLGVMFWEYSQDAQGELLDALYRELNANVYRD